MRKLHNNDMMNTFLSLKGNPKWSIITEPLWFIPFSLFTPFASLYMYQLGLSSSQIGITISVGNTLQVIFALLGGMITDKLGRRVTTLVFDFVSWCIPCIIWAFADNYIWFLIAAVINAGYQITNASWYCLFIEDCPPNHLTNGFALIYCAGSLSVFFLPIALYFVEKYSVVDVVSVIYLLSGISMGAKSILLYIFGGETQMGKQRKKETQNISWIKLFMGYKEVAIEVMHSGRMMFVVLFMAITNIILISTNNFFSLYITEKVGVSDQMLAVFSMVRTAIMLIFVVLLQNIMNRILMKRMLLIGFLCYIVSHIILLLAPPNSILFIILYTVFEALAYSIITPRKDAIMGIFVEVKNRSRIYALFNSGMIALSAPFGIIFGRFFERDMNYPFFLNIILFLLSILLILKVDVVAKYESEAQGEIMISQVE